MSSLKSLEIAIEQKFIERAKALAMADGHKNIDELIVLKGGRRIPVWKFYMKQAQRA